jgi:hypothetical protein
MPLIYRRRAVYVRSVKKILADEAAERVSGIAEHPEDMVEASDRRVYILVAVVTQS